MKGLQSTIRKLKAVLSLPLMKTMVLAFILILTRVSFASNEVSENIQVKPAYTHLEQTLINLFLPFAQARGFTNITINQDFNFVKYAGGVNTLNGEIRIIFGSEFKDVYTNLTEDAYAKILCHELGHILGNTEASEQPEGVKVSPEAGSDYFAGAVCLPKLFKAVAPSAPLFVDPVVILNCSLQYTEISEQLICQRVAMAGFSFFTAFRESLISTVPEIQYEKFYAVPDFKIKDQGQYDFYPSFQCRNETVAAGAYCSTSQAQWESGNKKWHCKEGLGARPSCWFNF